MVATLAEAFESISVNEYQDYTLPSTQVNQQGDINISGVRQQQNRKVVISNSQILQKIEQNPELLQQIKERFQLVDKKNITEYFNNGAYLQLLSSKPSYIENFTNKCHQVLSNPDELIKLLTLALFIYFVYDLLKN
jgi:hypothetical protein